MESGIIRELEQYVLQQTNMLVHLAGLLAELDWYEALSSLVKITFVSVLSLAAAARLPKWSRPVITADPELHIVGGRHPLQELCVSTCIAISFLVLFFFLSLHSDRRK